MVLPQWWWCILAKRPTSYRDPEPRNPHIPQKKRKISRGAQAQTPLKETKNLLKMPKYTIFQVFFGLFSILKFFKSRGEKCHKSK